MNYMYTNDELYYVLEMPENVPLDWEYFGSNSRAMSRACAEGFQARNENDIMITMMPILNEETFYTAMESKLGTDSKGHIIKVISEEQAIAERDRLKAINDAKAAEAARTAPPSDSELLQMLIELEADKIGGAV